MAKKHLIGIISLGCDKNQVDTETMITHLQDAGFVFTPDPSEAEVIIVNTCAFIKTSRDESESVISEMLEYKKSGTCKRLIVTGCYPQKDLAALRLDFPEIDVFLGTNEYQNIVDIVNESLKSKKDIIKVDSPYGLDYVETNRVITTPAHYAYLKIADGCDNFCTYCTIPYIRGRYRSRELNSLISEATSLVNNGAKEIILVAQDITKYGEDLYKEPKLVELIRELSKINKLDWIRLLYCYPESVSKELLEEIVNNPKVCKYIDIPLQHVSNNILAKMNRKIDYSGIVRLISNIRSYDVPISLRTTFIVGFPGETEEDEKKLIDFIKEYKLNNVGFFAYQKEEGTAAATFSDQIDELEKEKRLVRVIKTQQKVVKIIGKNLVGKTLKVLYEGIDFDKKLFYGRTEYMAPEIDGLVYFKSKIPLEVGNFYDVKMSKNFSYDFKGEVIK